MSGRNEGSDEPQLWSLLSEAGLLDVAVNDVLKRIQEAKHAVMQRLVLLAGQKHKTEERESEAYALGTLKKLETLLAQHRAPQHSSRASSVNEHARRKREMHAKPLQKR